MTLRLKSALLVLPISLLILAGCGDDAGSTSDDDSQASGSEAGSSPESGSESGSEEGSDSSGGFDETTDLCSLVSEETLAASNLSASDGAQKEWVVDQACIYGENLDRRIIVQVDFDNSLGAIETGDPNVEEMNGHPVEVGYDSEMTCLYSFTPDDDTKIDVIVEDLGDTEATPGEPCDAGRPALDDVMEKVA